MNTSALTDSQLREDFDAACRMANELYVQGKDTSEIDERVDALMAELDNRGL